jgi:hypothetical protein
LATTGARRPLSIEVALGVLAAAAGAVVGAAALVDNSFLTHLATGRIIWAGDGIPTQDPYSFTAAGEPWVVQSWLASVLYGGVEELAGLTGIRVLMAATTACLGALTWTLTRPAGTLAGRLLAFAPAFVVGAGGAWPERPLLLGLLAMGGVMLAAEHRLDPRWLVPVGWLWVNVHGSWPLGVVALVCLAAGARLDGRDAAVELRALRWFAGGLALAVLNPYGPRLMLFPLTLLSRRESLEGIVEWGPMDFGSIAQWGFLALLLVGIVAATRRPSWRHTVPLVVFGAATLTGVRNVPVATIVLLPGVAAGLAGLGEQRGHLATRIAAPVAAVGVALGAVAVVSISTTADFQEAAYPVDAHEWLRDNDLAPDEHRIVAREFVGNWFEAVYGPTGEVFMDDRIEVMPTAVVRDHRLLLRGDPTWADILGRYEPEAVLWESDSPLAAILAVDDGWRITFRDDDWIVAVPVAG